MRTRLQFLDPADIDDDRAMNPQEDLGVKRSLQRVHRNMEQVIRARGMQLDVVLCGFHHAERYRLPASGDTAGLAGRWYGGWYHTSIEDAERQGYLWNDGGIDQLLSFLSGERDEWGFPIPHPLDWDRADNSVSRRLARPKRVHNTLE